MKDFFKKRTLKIYKSIDMALDLVEDGNNIHMDDIPKNQLPENITSKMLYKDIVSIAWPSALEMSLTQLASMVDLMMVGQLGPWALAAVGLTLQPKFLLMIMFMSMNVGATSMVARYKGAGNQKKANLILRQALLLTITFSIIASIIGFIFSEQLVKFMGATDAQTLAG